MEIEVEEIIKIIKLLPKYEEIKLYAKDELEANYIFKITDIALLAYLQNYENKSTKHFDDEEASYLIESLVERMWEKINIGHFSEVPLNLRQIYSAACFYKIIFNLISLDSDLEKCNETLDKAILIGCTENLYENCEKLIENITELFNKSLGTKPTTSLPYIEPLLFENLNCDIQILDCPTIENFNENFFRLQKPALIRNIINHWPALTKWRDPNYLLKIAGNRSVPIEIGSNYKSEDWSQELIKIKDFLNRHFSSNKTNSVEVEYLAQHELFDQVPRLKEDIKIPDYCYCNSKDNSNDIDIKAWLGPEHTISPMHQDPKHNILCQVFGKKKIILASSDSTEYLYPHIGKFLNNTSEIDAENLDLEKFPLVKNVKFYNLILQEGECLYLPPKWWHYVRSLSKSFSVSFWWE